MVSLNRGEDGMPTELIAEQLRKSCPAQALGCQTTEELPPLERIIGQERAVRALRFGLSIKDVGFNIYVAGPSGTGRTTAVERFIEDVARSQPIPGDWCYVNNFSAPHRPVALPLPVGRARQLQRDLKSLVEAAKREIRESFDSDEYAAKREETIRGFQDRGEALIATINRLAAEQGFLIRSTPVGLMTIPLEDGEPLSEEEFSALTEEEQALIAGKKDKLQTEVEALIRQGKGLKKRAGQAVEKLDREVAGYALGPMIEDLKEDYADLAGVVKYLDEVQADMLENLALFREEADDQPTGPFRMPGTEELPYRRYEVNVLVDNSDLEGAPVVVELNPTYKNVFGGIEKEAQFGTLVTDFTHIREGAIHRANGGYLVLPVEDVLRNPFTWESLKRALRNREIVIEDAGEKLGFFTTESLRPEPSPLDAKVVLIGNPSVYQLLYALDDDFSELFKVKADFDVRMDRTDDNVASYAAWVCTLCCDEALRHLDASALSKIVEHGSRLADDQTKLTTRFGEVSDIIREASFYARQEAAPYTTGAHVRKAIEERFYRSSLLQERVREMIITGSIMIDVTGQQVGQVNGLSVVGLGDVMFGQPSRITATVALGQEGLIDIEREAKLGGPLHTKGVMILSGFLAERYAQDKPLSLSARLVFEQSYGGVEGDSASSTELYALLSSLSGLPIKQSIAVTGSVNQKGQTQPIGGVNQKIEGFFEVCRVQGLTGEQGVLIPQANVRNLMLKEEVVDAVRDGQFHVWPVSTVDEGIEILTGVPAGTRSEAGNYPEGTVNYLVDRRLRELAETMQAFGKQEDSDRPDGDST
jgi:lon-related putative ATP-dependent protease